jgi:hypothetical protein
MFDSMRTAAPAAWDTALLAPVAEINEQLLEHLQQLAGAGPTAADGMPGCGPMARGTPLRLIDGLRLQWQQLDAEALRRLSACPYLLLDAGFGQPHFWDRWLMTGVMDAAERGGYFNAAAGVALLRRALLLGWHLARSNRLMAAVVLGMNAAAAERMAQRRLKDLEALAELAPPWMAPRWEQQPLVWQQMIAAASGTRPEALRQVQLRGLQLLARECTRP